MPFPLGLAIAGGASLLGGLFGGSTPKYQGLTSQQINSLIDAYRRQGLEGIRTQGQRAQATASAQLAASGLEPSLALQQSLYTPILEQLSGARSNLETGLAQTEADLVLRNQMAKSGAEFGGALQSQQNLLGLLSGIGDIGGLLALQNSNLLGGNQGGFGNGNPFFAPFGLQDYNSYNRLG